jgi:hypothetical protein
MYEKALIGTGQKPPRLTIQALDVLVQTNYSRAGLRAKL